MLRFIRRTLEVNDLAVVSAMDGPAALKSFQLERPDLVVLDLGIPGMDGLELCRRLKATQAVPVIIVTARGDDDEVVEGFEAGAEDYLAKPFAGSVLVARVKALLRRAQDWAGPAGVKIRCGGLELDFESRRVKRGGHDIHLTPTEFKLLTLLARYRGKVLTSEEIISHLWGARHDGDPQVLRTHVGRLRRKIELDHGRPTLIRTEPGVGYWMDCPRPALEGKLKGSPLFLEAMARAGIAAEGPG